LNAHGIKISAIAQLSESAISQQVFDLSTNENEVDIHIDKLITSMLDLEEEKFVQDISSLESKFGFEATITTILYPFLIKIGVLWQTGNITPAHEHFISNIIRQRIIVAIDSLKIPSNKSLRVVLFLPEGELHEIGLLFHHYIVRKAGFLSFYLGQSVPFEDLKKVCEIHKPHLLITSCTSFPEPQNLDNYLKQVCKSFAPSWVFASGSILRKTSFHYHSNLKVFETIAQLKDLLNVFK
jgi:methanogenic corrinoid protein MtbC1